MATIEDLTKAAKDAHERAAAYAGAAKRLYDTLMASGGKLTDRQVEQYVDEIEKNRSSATAAYDLLGEILKDLAQTLAGKV